LSREERQQLIEWTSGELSSSAQTQLLGLNRTSLYYQPVLPSPEEIGLTHRIDELYTASPSSGSRRITEQLKREGHLVNRKAVRRQMQEMGLWAVFPGPNLSKRAHQAAIYPYLLTNITASAPNHVWGLDITSIRLRHGWLYLVAVLDWYSRSMVSWQFDQTMPVTFVLEALQQALKQARPVICNSDQGSQFTSAPSMNVLKEHEVQISMDGRGRALDNVFTERLRASVEDH
jgi:putative transposase